MNSLMDISDIHTSHVLFECLAHLFRTREVPPSILDLSQAKYSYILVFLQSLQVGLSAWIVS
jgi:hypothetical protein